jgi:cation transport regulator
MDYEPLTTSSQHILPLSSAPDTPAPRKKSWTSRDHAMPYRNIDELPENTRSNLPKHAQEIYLAAFNNAWEQYRKAEDRRGDSSREEVAHKVAWAAV